MGRKLKQDKVPETIEELRAQAKAELDAEIARIREHRRKAKVVLANAVVDAAAGVVDALRSKDPRIRFDAQKHLLKLNGFEVEQVELGGRDGQALTVVVKRYRKDD